MSLLHMPRVLKLVSGALAFATACAVSAQTYPVKPVRVLVGFAPGGGTELSARVLTEKLGPRLGQPVILESRPGNNGQTALEAAAKSPADGYLLIYSGGAAVTVLPVMSQVQFDTLRDFSAVATVAKTPLLMVASPELGITDLAGLRKKLVAEPDKHAYGSAGTGSGSHMGPAFLAKLLNTRLTEVPYKSSALAMPDLMAGRLAIHVDAPAVLVPLVQSGKLVGIAVLDNERIPGSSVPTIAEAGMPEYLQYDWTSWFVVLAPKGTPANVIERLNRETASALKDEELLKRYRDLGLTPIPRTAAASAQFLEERVKAQPKVFREMGITK